MTPANRKTLPLVALAAALLLRTLASGGEADAFPPLPATQPLAVARLGAPADALLLLEALGKTGGKFGLRTDSLSLPLFGPNRPGLKNLLSSLADGGAGEIVCYVVQDRESFVPKYSAVLVWRWPAGDRIKAETRLAAAGIEAGTVVIETKKLGGDNEEVSASPDEWAMRQFAARDGNPSPPGSKRRAGLEDFLAAREGAPALWIHGPPLLALAEMGAGLPLSQWLFSAGLGTPSSVIVRLGIVDDRPAVRLAVTGLLPSDKSGAGIRALLERPLPAPTARDGAAGLELIRPAAIVNAAGFGENAALPGMFAQTLERLLPARLSLRAGFARDGNPSWVNGAAEGFPFDCGRALDAARRWARTAFPEADPLEGVSLNGSGDAITVHCSLDSDGTPPSAATQPLAEEPGLTWKLGLADEQLRAFNRFAARNLSRAGMLYPPISACLGLLSGGETGGLYVRDGNICLESSSLAGLVLPLVAVALADNAHEDLGPTPADMAALRLRSLLYAAGQSRFGRLDPESPRPLPLPRNLAELASRLAGGGEWLDKLGDFFPGMELDRSILDGMAQGRAIGGYRYSISGNDGSWGARATPAGDKSLPEMQIDASGNITAQTAGQAGLFPWKGSRRFYD